MKSEQLCLLPGIGEKHSGKSLPAPTKANEMV